VLAPLIVRSFVSISDLTVTVLLTVSDVLGFVKKMEYFPGFKLIANFPTPLALVLMEYSLLLILNLVVVFFSSLPF
jgi:hypothetical protein